MDNTELLFEITKITNNMKQNNYTVGDYKVCESESKIILKALEAYKNIVGSWENKN